MAATARRRADLVRASQLLLTLAVVLSLASPATAQWRGGRGARGGWNGGYRGPPPPSAPRGGRGVFAPQGGFGGYPARGGGYGEGYAGRGYGGGSPEPGYGGFGGAPQRPAQALRRGQILPQGYGGARLPDPGRYHLRDAPSGYDWLGDGRDAYLVQRSTGMVLDSVPGAYQPPRGRDRDWR